MSGRIVAVSVLAGVRRGRAALAYLPVLIVANDREYLGVS